MTEQYTYQSNEKDTPLPPSDPVQPEERPTLTKKQFSPMILGGAITLVLISFISGFVLRGLFTPKPMPTPQKTVSSPTPLATPQATTPTPGTFSEIPASSIQFLPGKQYFEDSYAIVTKKQPYQTILVTVARIEQERNYAQYTKINYFNGKEWIRKAVTTTITNSNVVTNPLLRSWQMPQDRSTKKEPLAEISLNDETLSFNSDNVQSEISVESLPGSTKFIYQGTGTVTINDETMDAYILRSRSYSFNAIDLAFFNSPENLTSNFVSFWDEEGDFYYVDTHSTKNPTSPIQTRSVGIKENNRRIVSKTDKLNADFQQKNGVNEFIIAYDTPIKEQLRLTFFRTLNKSETNSYTWILSNATGNSVKAEGRTVKGIGIVEYIRPQSE